MAQSQGDLAVAERCSEVALCGELAVGRGVTDIGTLPIMVISTVVIRSSASGCHCVCMCVGGGGGGWLWMSFTGLYQYISTVRYIEIAVLQYSNAA